MPYSKLKTFVTVIDCGGIHAAARELARTPSAISQQLKSLQFELGVELTHHTKDGWVMTPAGRLLHRLTSESLSALDDGIRAVKTRESLSGDYVVGVEQGVFPAASLRRLMRFASHYPGLRLRIRSLGRRRLRSELSSERLDICLMLAGKVSAGYVLQKQSSQRILIVQSPHAPDSAPPIHLSPPVAPLAQSLRAYLADRACSGGNDSVQSWTVGDLSEAKNLSVAGLGVCALPAVSVRSELADGQLIVIPRHEEHVALGWWRLDDQREEFTEKIPDVLAGELLSSGSL